MQALALPCNYFVRSAEKSYKGISAMTRIWRRGNKRTEAFLVAQSPYGLEVRTVRPVHV